MCDGVCIGDRHWTPALEPDSLRKGGFPVGVVLSRPLDDGAHGQFVSLCDPWQDKQTCLYIGTVRTATPLSVPVNSDRWRPAIGGWSTVFSEVV